MLITSQQQNIQNGLALFSKIDVVLQSNEVDKDIRLYITEKVRNDLELGLRPIEVQCRIEDVPTEGASGM